MTNIEHAVEAARHDGDFGVMFLARAVGDLQKQLEQLPQQRTWVGLTDEQTNKAAMKLAECMDYPWTNMPEEGKREMRKHAKEIIEAAHGITSDTDFKE